MIRLGIIGCGVMAKAHLGALKELSDRARLTAFVDIDIERARALVAEHDGAVAAETCEEILDAVDAVILATPHDVHGSVGATCLAAGKHVLMEKPLALTEEECLRLIELDRSPDPVLMVGYVMRHDPLWTQLGDYIKEETFGPAFQVSIWTEQYTDLSRGAWLGEAARVGGGQLFSHGCHYIDLMLDWMGKPVSGSHIGTSLGTPWMEREGTSNVTILFESGAMGYHMGTWGARGSRHGYAVHAHCTEGMLELDYRAGRLSIHRDASGGDLPALPDDAKTLSPKETLLAENTESRKPTLEQLDAFFRCIEERTRPEIDAALSLRSLRVIWALYAAEDAGTLADLRGL